MKGDLDIYVRAGDAINRALQEKILLQTSNAQMMMMMMRNKHI